jgi:hypothetical protein
MLVGIHLQDPFAGTSRLGGGTSRPLEWKDALDYPVPERTRDRGGAVCAAIEQYNDLVGETQSFEARA